MRIKVTRGALLKGLKTVNSAAGSGKDLAIFKCVKIEPAGEQAITLSTNTIDQTALARVELAEAADAQAEAAAVDAEKLTRFAAAMDEGPIEITVKNNKATIQNARTRFSLMTEDTSKIAVFAKVPDGPQITLSAAAIMDLIKKTKFAVAEDGSRTELKGINFEQTAGGPLTVTACNGMQIVSLCTDTNAAEAAKATIPTVGVEALEKILQEHDEDRVTFTIGEKAIEAAGAGWAWGCRLLSRSYPSWRNVTPEDPEGRTDLGREDLLAAINRMALAIDKDDPNVTITVEDNTLKLAAKSSTGAGAHEELACKYAGEKITISANPEKIRPFLSTVDQDDVTIFWGDGAHQVMVQFPGLNYVGVFMTRRRK